MASVEAAQGSSEQVPASPQQQAAMAVSSPQQIRMVVPSQPQMHMVGSPQRQVPMVASPQHQVPMVASSQNQGPMVASPQHQVPMVTSPHNQVPMVASPQHQVPMEASPQHQVPTVSSPQHQTSLTGSSPQHIRTAVSPQRQHMSAFATPQQAGVPTQPQVQGAFPPQQIQAFHPQQQVQAVLPPQQIQIIHPPQQIQVAHSPQQIQAFHPPQQAQSVLPPQQMTGVTSEHQMPMFVTPQKNSVVSSPQQQMPMVSTPQPNSVVSSPQQQMPMGATPQQNHVVSSPQQQKPASPQKQTPPPQGTQQLTPLAMEFQNPNAEESQQHTPKQQKHTSGDTPMVNSPSPSSGVYPAPLATHAEVVANRDLFYDTLNKFHAALGTRLMIPTIGGKELDLHVFYIEVSGRGGFDQVVKDRKWKEITVAFDFPPTTTSASFVLRKYYVLLLHHYEQVYYFGAKGPLVPPAGMSPGPAHTVNGTGKNGLHDKEKKRKKSSLDITSTPDEHKAVDLGASLGHTVSGFIDGKFEHGYLVTVTVGSDLLRGVLYHMPSGCVPQQYASVPSVVNGANLNGSTTPADSNAEVRRRRRRRRKDEMPKKDPNAPKPNRSGYNFFFQEQHTRLRALHPDKDREISRLIGESWNKLTEEERAVYQEQGVRDKERYKREMEDYRRKLQSQDNSQVSGNVNSDAQDASENNEDVQLEETTFGSMDEKPIDSNSYVPSMASEADQFEFSGPSEQAITNNN